ncbi:hypothetical protein ACFX1Q_028291 [Malus domestica]
MRGYGRDECYQSVKEYDDYEDEGYGEAEDGKKDTERTNVTVARLDFRQCLKEQHRKKLEIDGGSSQAKSYEKKKLPYDNYGSFFGPYQPVTSQRVIQVTQQLSSRFNPLQLDKKSSGSTSSGSKSVSYGQKPKVMNEKKTKVQMIREMRDYSQFFSKDADCPAPAKDCPPQNVSLPNSGVRSNHMAMKIKQPLESNGRKPPTMKEHIHSEVGSTKLISARRRIDSKSMGTRKQLESNENGSGRPLGSKGLPLKMSASTTERKTSAPGVKNSTTSGLHKPLPPKSQSSVSRQHLTQKTEVHMPNTKPKARQSTGLSKPQQMSMQQLQKQTSPRTMYDNRPKKKRRCSDDDYYDPEAGNVRDVIRKMFRYNPDRFAGDAEDDSDMEAGFEDIQREERRSALIARREDEEQARLIEAEERKERMARLRKQKKRQLVH